MCGGEKQITKAVGKNSKVEDSFLPPLHLNRLPFIHSVLLLRFSADEEIKGFRRPCLAPIIPAIVLVEASLWFPSLSL
ncbi:hypothetical protein L1887_13392 [Cichorium endivia]|nr:hypothetical protein L1887_13392 [Cichorium endivia]